jgi:membrane protein DedA with SNARE-associated domain/rhodanese-related sulfurtransferase
MTGTAEFLIRHGYTLLFVWILAEQLGLPIPAGPLMLAVGALAKRGLMSLPTAFMLPLIAVGICDLLWYELGRRGGMRVLKVVCRISLEPDSCVRRTQLNFERNGGWALVVAKFIPGLNAIAPPLAGVSRMPWRRFALFDGLGAVLWTGAYIGTGYIFSAELARIAEHLAFLGRGLVAAAAAALAGYIGFKFVNRRRFLRKLRVARITADELKEKIDANEEVIVVDLRHALEFEAEPETIPGAVHMDAAEMEEALDVIPRDRDIVLFCNCPNEATAAEMASRLQRLGITRIRPLAGGLDGWRNRGFPLQALKITEVLRETP